MCENKLDYNYYLDYVSELGYRLIKVPEEFKDERLCLQALKRDKHMLEYVPESVITLEMCEIAIGSYMSMDYIPEKFKTYEFCKKAVSVNSYFLRNVPKEFLTFELCLIAVKCNQYCLKLECFPEEHKTYELCLAAVQNTYYESDDDEIYSILEYIPMSLRDEEMCEAALKSNSGAIEHVPEPLKEFMFKILKSLDLRAALCQLPVESTTKEDWIKLFEENIFNLQYIPDEYKTREMCLKVMKENGLYLESVPMDFRDEEMCLEALKTCPCAIGNVPEKYLTKEICFEAVKQGGWCVKNVPKKFIDNEMYLLALSTENKI